MKALPGRHVLALDLRGHGRSGKTPPFSWDSYGNDLVAWAEYLGLAGAMAAGHSMGGYANNLVARKDSLRSSKKLSPIAYSLAHVCFGIRCFSLARCSS